MGKCRKCGKELTGIETTGWFGKLCEKCWQEQHYTQYPFKKGIDEKDKKIADLEAKLLKFAHRISDQNEEILELKQQLAEKEQAIESLQEINQSLGQTCNNDAKEIERLREQLAEKDIEIENLKNANSGLSQLIGMKDKTFYAIEISEFQSKQNQTAIDELEKVKEYIREFVGINDVKFICTTTITDQIDQQITELKGEK